MKKRLKIFTTITLLLLTLISIYFFYPWNKNFFNIAKKEFTIPALETGFTPQGITKIEKQNKYIISGYMSDGSPSRFYILNGETGNIEKYFTLIVDNKKYNGHAGGIASYENTLWTVSTGYCFKFNLNDVISAKNGGEIKIEDYFETFNRADYIFTNNKTLWIGEFYREQNYPTKENHNLKTRSGEINPAVIYGFEIDENKKYGISNHLPAQAISTRALIQDIKITNKGNFILSASYGITDSNIYYYKNILNENNHSTIKLENKTLPLWYLDNQSLISSLKIPSMSEGIFIDKEKIYILFESGCKKYYYNKVRIKNIYSIPDNYLDK